MRKILLVFILIITSSFPGYIVYDQEPIKSKKSNSVNKPKRPHRPVRPVIVNPVVYQDNYYNTTIEDSCNKYIEIIDKKDKEIAALQKEVERLRSEADERLQKNLKKEHDKEIEEFDNRRSIKIKNSFSISDK